MNISIIINGIRYDAVDNCSDEVSCVKCECYECNFLNGCPLESGYFIKSSLIMPKEFVEHVSQMRNEQKSYLKNHSEKALAYKRKLEKLVDSELNNLGYE